METQVSTSGMCASVHVWACPQRYILIYTSTSIDTSCTFLLYCNLHAVSNKSWLYSSVPFHTRSPECTHSYPRQSVHFHAHTHTQAPLHMGGQMAEALGEQ